MGNVRPEDNGEKLGDGDSRGVEVEGEDEI